LTISPSSYIIIFDGAISHHLASLSCQSIKNGLDVIDHRAWSPRGINTTLVNEVYARTQLPKREEGEDSNLLNAATDGLLEKLEKALETAINQPGVSKVKAQRWYPGVVQEIVEEVEGKSHKNITQRLLKEAANTLEQKQSVQTLATRQKSVNEILGHDVEKGETAGATISGGPTNQTFPVKRGEGKPRRRIRQRMRSTPVVGGGLFGETIEAKSGRESHTRISDVDKKKGSLDWSFGTTKSGIPAEITVKGEIYSIRIARDTWKGLQKGYAGQMVDTRGIEISSMNIEASDDAPIVQRLTGFVRNMPLRSITEDDEDSSHMDNISERSIDDASRHKGDGFEIGKA
jgi:hypothetical protein